MLQSTEPQSVDFFYIAALPKSASSFAWVVASALQEPDERPNQARQLPGYLNPFAPLTTRILELFPTGGTYKSHAPFDSGTAEFLESTQCKYSILLRHPADFIASLYCHERGLMLASDPGGAAETPAAGLWGGNVDAVFGLETEIEVAIGELLRKGALSGALTWIARWLHCRTPERSIVTRYEDLISNLEETVTTWSLLIRNSPPSRSQLDYLRGVGGADAAANWADASRAKYPRGWTGRVGIWRDYFSPANARLYNRVLDDFLVNCSRSEVLFSIYPDIQI